MAIAFALVIAVAIYAFGTTSGAHINPAVTVALAARSLNPARTFGPLFVTALWGGDAEWGDLPAYVAGPVLGGVLSAFAYDLVVSPRRSG